jgi:hypothetical protein
MAAKINYTFRCPELSQDYTKSMRTAQQSRCESATSSGPSASDLVVDKYSLSVPYTGTKDQPETVSLFLTQGDQVEFYDEAIINSLGHSPFEWLTAIERIKKAAHKIWEEIALGVGRENSAFGNACNNLIRGVVQLVPILGNGALYLFDHLRTNFQFHPWIKTVLTAIPRSESVMGIAFDGSIVAQFPTHKFLNQLGRNPTASTPQGDKGPLALLAYTWISVLQKSSGKLTRLQCAKKIQAMCPRPPPNFLRA